jgi:type VI secretion system protein ImpH
MSGWIFDPGEANGFEFYQAVRLLEDLHARSAPASGGEAVRFQARVGLDFPPSDVAQVEAPARPGAPARMTVSVLGLAGVSGPLPRPFAELLVERTFRKDGALRAFLDLFHHRLVSLLYRVRSKHRLALSPRRPDRAMLARPLFALMGLGTPGTRGRMRRERVRDPALLAFAGLISQKPRTMAGLRCLLGQYFRVPVEGAGFQGRWLHVEPEDRTHLGFTGRNQRLGRDAVLGKRVWDQQAGIALTVGPLPLARFLDLLPIGASHRPFRELTRFYVGHEPDVSVRLVLRAAEVPAARLGDADGRGGARLGWTSWVRTRPAAADGVVRLG